MAPARGSGVTAAGDLQLIQYVDQMLERRITPLQSQIHSLAQDVEDLQREVRDANSAQIAAPGRSIVLPLNGWTVAIAIALAAIVVLALAGQAGRIPDVVSAAHAPKGD